MAVRMNIIMAGDLVPNQRLKQLVKLRIQIMHAHGLAVEIEVAVGAGKTVKIIVIRVM